MTAPGLFTDHDQVMRIMLNPETQKLVYGLGVAKGVVGVGFAPMSPSSILTKKPVKQISDLKGQKVRVLASPFQLELIRRMDASPIAMTLADVLPALQQGTIDGTLTSIVIYTTMHYYDTAKYVIETEQPYVNSIAMLSKRWIDTLPPDLQKIIYDDAAKVTNEITPYVKQFVAAQDKIWADKGGQRTTLPKAEHDAMIAKVSTIGDDLSKSKPGLNQTVKALFEAKARAK
jgi:TRAP-type C4-dicarboxylate transport system substrate-binding protein